MGYISSDRDLAVTIKQNIRNIRLSKKISQGKLAEGIHIGENQSGRTSITTWESEKNTILPGLLSFLEICDFFNVDVDYLLGKTNIQSKDNGAIADAIHITEAGASRLREHPEYGPLIDFLVHHPVLPEITGRLHQLSYMEVFEDVMNTSFSPQLKRAVIKSFDRYQNQVFPMDMSCESFEEYLKKNFPFTEGFNGVDYAEQNFMEDGKLYIYNAHDGFDSLSPLEQYGIIISAIGEISYEFLMRQQVVELSKQRIVGMLSDCVEQFIQLEAQRTKAQMKDYAVKVSQEV